MKTLSNNLAATRSLAIASLVALVFVAIPTSSILAAERDNQFCRTIDTKQANTTNRLNQRVENIEHRLNDRDTKLDDHFATIDTRRSANRATWEDRRDDRYTKLLTLADTDGEKQAVDTYESTIETAVKKRQSAVDAAVATFRSGLDQSVEKRETGVLAATDRFSASVDSAFSEAKAHCRDDTVSLTTIRAEFRSDIRTAKAQLKADIQALDKIRTDRTALAGARKSSIESAVKTFESEAKTAREILKSAFGK